MPDDIPTQLSGIVRRRVAILQMRVARYLTDKTSLQILQRRSPKRTGKLRASWTTKLIKRNGRLFVRLRNDSGYAPYVFFGNSRRLKSLQSGIRAIMRRAIRESVKQ